MVGPDRIEWRRGFPSRAVRDAGWTVVVAGVVIAASWVVFGTEPDRLASGRVNPLAELPLWTTTVGIVAVGVACVPLIRRPVVAATYYALSVRPGALRTLLVPWSNVAEVVVAEEYLLVRLRRRGRNRGDRPTAWEQAILREARRRVVGAADYDLAVRLREFTGPPAGNLAALAAYAPEDVHIVHR